MYMIAFSTKSSKFLPQLLCKNFKHCCPVIKIGSVFLLFQFTSAYNISILSLSQKDINLLKKFGWVFININKKSIQNFDIGGLSCVQFSKKFFGLKKIKIQTPDALFNYLTKEQPI